MENITFKLILVVVVFGFVLPVFGRLQGQSGTQKNFNRPVMPVGDFNKEMAQALGEGAFVWNDANQDKTFVLGDGSIDGKEFSGKEVKKFFVEVEGKSHFTVEFHKVYSTAMENLRRRKIEKELTLTFVQKELTDVSARLMSPGKITPKELGLYRNGIKTLMQAAPIVEWLYQAQIGTSPTDFKKTATANDKELFKRYGHPWCLGDVSPFCVAVSTLPKRTSGIIPEGVSCEKSNAVGSPFEALFVQGGELKPVSFSEVWKQEHKKLSLIVKKAAAFFGKIPREAKFAQHLMDLWAAFQSKEPYPYAVSDVSWAEFLASESVLFLRLGPDEVGGDGVGDLCESRARFHFNLGIRNTEAQEIIGKLEPVVQVFEKRITALIDDPKHYVERPVRIQLPIFLDVIYSNGDDVGGPSGTPIGQTLPNWCGADGKGECERGTMVYSNKTTKAYSDEIIKKHLMPLFEDQLSQFFNSKKGLDSVVYHEVFHNLGPRDKVKKPNSKETYGEKLTTVEGVSWRLPLEELKAQTGSLYMANEFYKEAVEKFNSKQMTAEVFEKEVRNFKEHIIYDLAWAFRMIVRGSRTGPEFNPQSPYSKLAAVQVGFLAEQGALAFDKKTKKWSVNFEKMPDAINILMKKVGELYARSEVTSVEQFFLHYIKGDGEKLLHRDVLLEVAGKMPSVLFDYQPKP